MLKQIAEIIENDFESQLQDLDFTYDVTIWSYENESIVEIDNIEYKDKYYDFGFYNKGMRIDQGETDMLLFLANLKTNLIELVKQLEDELDANTPQGVKDANEREYRAEQRADDVRAGL